MDLGSGRTKEVVLNADLSGSPEGVTYLLPTSPLLWIVFASARTRVVFRNADLSGSPEGVRCLFPWTRNRIDLLMIENDQEDLFSVAEKRFAFSRTHQSVPERVLVRLA